MDGKKQNSSVVVEPPSGIKSIGPVKVFKAEDVSASVFVRDVPVKGEVRTFYSVSFSRSYRDSKNERRYVKSFNLEDLGKVVTVAQQADEYIRKLSA